MSLHPQIHQEEQQPIKQSFCRSLRRDTHWKCLLLTLLICGCLAAITWCRLTTVNRVTVNIYNMPFYMHHHQANRRASPCEDGYVYIPVAFVAMLYLVYLVECWHCHTRIELRYKVDVNTVYEKTQLMRECLPVVWWKAICYHYVRRTRQVTRYRNGDAFTSTQVYYERVNSHTASSAFNFSQCGVKDISKNLVNLEMYPATKIHFSKGFSFATSDAEREFEEQRCQFFHDHERRDDYMETREGLDLMNVNFKEYMISFADPDNLPWYVSHVVFWLASTLLFSWPLRVLIEYKTAYVHFHVHKLFGSNYMDPAFVPGRMTRVNTMESTELEMNIRNNFTMVPSYSEALLMDAAFPLTTQDANANLTPSVSFHNGYINIPGINHPSSRTQSSHHVTSGCVPGGGYVITNGIAHALSGPIPMSSSNGSVGNGTVTHNGISGGQSSNRRSSNGGIAAWVLQRGEEHAIISRRKKRKRKCRRHSFTDTSLSNPDTNGATTISNVNTLSTLGIDQPQPHAPQVFNPATSIPPSESCPEALEPSTTPPSALENSPPQQTVEESIAWNLPRSESTVTEAPPSYELALTMRVPLPSVSSDQSSTSSSTAMLLPSLSNRNSPPYRLMETSL